MITPSKRPLRRAALIIFAFTFFAGLQASAQQTVILDSGDQLTGTLRSIEGTTWIFRFSGSDIRLPAERVVNFTTENAVGLRLSDGTILAARVESAPSGMRLVGDNVDGRSVLSTDITAIGNPADLEALEPVHISLLRPFTKFWGANAAFGFSDKSGNSRARGLSFSMEAARRSPKDRLMLQMGGNRESSQSTAGVFEATVSKFFAAARLDVFVNTRFFLFSATRQERDRFQDIALRSSYNIGWGFQAINKPKTDWNLSFAGGWRREDFFTAASPTDLSSVGTLSSVLRHDFGPAVFSWTSEFSPKFGEPGDFRLTTDAHITAPLFKGVGFRVGMLDEFQSRPPVGIEKNDLLITTRLSYSIGG
ncbi:MAG: DUF481 domain-containing protein [Gemmatimonadota bacterium]|nr:DUF481 domain-containing protein [Gemmatimonadota bacterium]MDH5803819.1 DUF481 domain-containing protein [Gemmatimonadota bacterium]